MFPVSPVIRVTSSVRQSKSKCQSPSAEESSLKLSTQPTSRKWLSPAAPVKAASSQRGSVRRNSRSAVAGEPTGRRAASSGSSAARVRPAASISRAAHRRSARTAARGTESRPPAARGRGRAAVRRALRPRDEGCEVAAQFCRRARRIGRAGGLPRKEGESGRRSHERRTHQEARVSCWLSRSRACSNVSPLAQTAPNAILRICAREGCSITSRVRSGEPATGILHPEEHDRLVDDHELEGQVRDEARLLAGRQEPLDTPDEGGVVERRQLVDAPRDVVTGNLEALDVLLRPASRTAAS